MMKKGKADDWFGSSIRVVRLNESGIVLLLFIFIGVAYRTWQALTYQRVMESWQGVVVPLLVSGVVGAVFSFLVYQFLIATRRS